MARTAIRSHMTPMPANSFFIFKDLKGATLLQEWLLVNNETLNYDYF
jgi:hypothetical protein